MTEYQRAWNLEAQSYAPSAAELLSEFGEVEPEEIVIDDFPVIPVDPWMPEPEETEYPW